MAKDSALLGGSAERKGLSGAADANAPTFDVSAESATAIGIKNFRLCIRVSGYTTQTCVILVPKLLVVYPTGLIGCWEITLPMAKLIVCWKITEGDPRPEVRLREGWD